MKMSFSAAIVIALAIAGCKTSSGFDRGPIRERPAGERPRFGPNDGDIAQVLAARPQVRFPMRVAVLLGSADGKPTTWTVGDEAAIGAWAEPLRSRGIVSDIFVVPEGLKSGSTLHDARLAAARCGADAVLILDGDSRVDCRVNPLALLNILVLPGWFVPASHRDAKVTLRAVLFDVANEYVYLAAASEGEGSIVRPTFRVRSEEALQLAREKALAGLGLELDRRLAGLKS